MVGDRKRDIRAAVSARGGAAFVWACGALLFLWLLALTVVPISGWDTWFHLKVGQWVIEHRAVPHTNVFMYTTPDHPWIDHSWLSEVLFYLGYLVTGRAGLPLLIALVIAASVAALWRLWFRLGGGADLAPIAFGLALVAASPRFDLRPELFTFLGVSLLLSILHSHRFQSTRHAWALPVLGVVWANAHGGWLAGIAMMWIFVGAEAAAVLLDRLRRRPAEAPRIRRLACWALAATAATVVNPYGYHWFEAVDPRRLRDLLRHIDEWSPLFGPRSVVFVDALRPNALLALLALTVVTVIAAGRRVSLSSVALLVFAIAIAVGARRNSGLAAWICLPILAVESRAAMAGFAGRTLATWGRAVRGRSWLAYRLAIIIALAAGAGHLWVRGIIPELRPGLGVNEARLPIGAMRFIEQVDLRGPMFNMYGQGAYLIWQWAPREKVFIDGLNAYPFSWYEHYARIAGGDEDLARVISQWGIRYFLLDRDQFSRAGPQRLIAQLEGLGWRLVYYDGRDFIYVPDAPENRDLIARYAYHYLRPVAVGVESDLDHPAELRAELQRMIASNPQSPHGHDSAARILLALEDPLAAANEWEAMVRLSRNPAQAYLRLGRACAALGLTDRELDSYRRAARLSPRNADIRRALADFYQNAGQFRESVAERKRVIRLQRRDPSGHFELARTYAIQAQAAGAPKEQLLRRARAELTTASRLGPSAMIAHALGSVHLELGNAPAAMRAFEQGIALDPTWFPNYLGLAQAQEAARDRAGAIDAWRRALAHAPDADAARLAQERLRALQPPAPGVDAIPD